MNRRQFFHLVGGAGTLALFNRRMFGYSGSPNLRKFIQALPGLGPTGIPLASPNQIGGEDRYTIEMGAYTQVLHPDLPPTHLWGYADITRGPANRRYLGPAIVAQRGRPVRIKYINNLPGQHPLPVDVSIDPGIDAAHPVNRAVPHLHGGLVPWWSDGGPMSWWAPNGSRGEDYVTDQYYYPNDQSARLIWYHDHAMGITRLNAYAGLAAPYILRDRVENALTALRLLPGGAYEVPLVIQDRVFVDGTDPNYQWGGRGDFWYPYVYEPDRWDRADTTVVPPSQTKPLPVPSAVPEFFGDTILVNGAVYPTLRVEQRWYRFRILNGSQARFYNLQLYYADTSGTKARMDRSGPAMVQIGTEGGFLPAPVVLNAPAVPFSMQEDTNGNPIGSSFRYNLLLAPGERADVLINFASVPANSKLILYNDAPAPFPMGDASTDFSSGASGPDTRTLLQFQVVPRTGTGTAPDLAFGNNVAAAVALVRGALVAALEPNLSRLGVRVLGKTLNEDFDDYGRLVQRQGTTDSRSVNNQGADTWGLAFTDAVTETPRAGETQVWRIFNLTGDTHPIHFHLTNVKVLSRAPFAAGPPPDFTRFGPARPPDFNELGWKETVRMNPGEVTEVIMRFDLPKSAGAPSPRTGGHNYVWHCHILEHEEHDMMRPLIVMP